MKRIVIALAILAALTGPASADHREPTDRDWAWYSFQDKKHETDSWNGRCGMDCRIWLDAKTATFHLSVLMASILPKCWWEINGGSYHGLLELGIVEEWANRHLSYDYMAKYTTAGAMWEFYRFHHPACFEGMPAILADGE